MIADWQEASVASNEPLMWLTMTHCAQVHTAVLRVGAAGGPAVRVQRPDRRHRRLLPPRLGRPPLARYASAYEFSCVPVPRPASYSPDVPSCGLLLIQTLVGPPADSRAPSGICTCIIDLNPIRLPLPAGFSALEYDLLALDSPNGRHWGFT